MPVGKPFEKGNTAGKIKTGQPNKLTKDLRIAIANFCEKSFDQIELDFMSRSPKERCQLFAALVQYVVPKKNTMEVTPAQQIPDEYTALDFEQLTAIEEIVKRKPLLTNGTN